MAPITVEQTYDVPASSVWKAITVPAEMRQWFFEPIENFEPALGFETNFNVECEGRNFLHLLQVTEVVPERVIEYSWCYDGVPGVSSVRWELNSEADEPAKTHVKLTHSGQETFPQDDPMFSREAGQEGWEYFLQDALKNFLCG